MSTQTSFHAPISAKARDYGDFCTLDIVDAEGNKFCIFLQAANFEQLVSVANSLTACFEPTPRRDDPTQDPEEASDGFTDPRDEEAAVQDECDRARI